MRILELFCGTKSISKVFEGRGHQIVTLDNNTRFQPNICIDIMDFRKDMLPTGFKPDVIWASPPCQCFSVASISTHWTGGHRAYIPKTEKAKIAQNMVKKTLELIDEIQPKYWFIENPRGVLRKMPFMDVGTRHTVTYCQYGKNHMKPTDIWTNCENWNPKPMCKNGAPCHERAPRGSRTGTQGLKDDVERGMIPRNLCEEIYHAVKDE